jgi:hypothetical protein
MKLVLGNITFEAGKAIVHEITGIINCTNHQMIGKSSKDVAEELGEELVNMFDAYLIPELWEGEIIYECNRSMDVDDDSEWEDEDEQPNHQEMSDWFYNHDNEWQNDQEEEFVRLDIERKGYDVIEWSWLTYHKKSEK